MKPKWSLLPLLISAGRKVLGVESAFLHQFFDESSNLGLRCDIAHHAPADAEVIPVASRNIQRSPAESRGHVQTCALVHQELDNFFGSSLSGRMQRSAAHFVRRIHVRIAEVVNCLY